MQRGKQETVLGHAYVAIFLPWKALNFRLAEGGTLNSIKTLGISYN
jgi:hypothetical protein